MTDRFSSREEMEYNPYAFNKGVEARKAGLSIDSHPSFMRGWSMTSFRAGWSDEDANQLAASPESEGGR